MFLVLAFDAIVLHLLDAALLFLNLNAGHPCSENVSTSGGNTAIESAAADKEIAAITQLKKHRDLSQSLHEIFDECLGDLHGGHALDFH